MVQACGTGWTRDQYIMALRIFLRDTTEQNYLLCNKEESTGDELGLYLDLALDYFNNDIPFTCYGYENFLSKHWLIFRAIVEQQFSLGFLHTRNTLDYSDGGRSVRDFGKQSSHLSFINALIAQTETHKRRMKRDINARAFMGTLPSEYSFVNSYITQWNKD